MIADDLDTIQVKIPEEKILQFCKQYHIRQLALFGSVLRDDFRSDSDIDILIEFEPDIRMGYFQFFRIERELSALLGRSVDMFTEDSLKPFAREEALKTARVIYAA